MSFRNRFKHLEKISEYDLNVSRQGWHSRFAARPVVDLSNLAWNGALPWGNTLDPQAIHSPDPYPGSIHL